MRPDRRCIPLCLALLASAAPSVSAQAVLKFNPRVGSLMRTQTDVEVATTYVGLPAVPDSETATLSMRAVVSRRPLAQHPVSMQWLVQLTLDSARATSKFGSAGRKDVPFSFDGTAISLSVDSAMRWGAADTPIPPSQLADTASRGFTKAVAPMFMLPLPGKPVSAGTTWNLDHPIPLADLMPIGVPGAVPGPRQLVAHVAAKVDSLVPRGTDTLAYVSYTGRYEPSVVTSRDTSGTSTTTVQGVLAASQIWSTAWSGWVSGAIRSRTELKLHTGTSDAVISADVTARMQVRP